MWKVVVALAPMIAAEEYKWPSGAFYKGDLNAQDKPDGRGEMNYANGSRYEGRWNNGQKVQGELYLNNDTDQTDDDAKYEPMPGKGPNFKNDKMNGWGKIEWMGTGATYAG